MAKICSINISGVFNEAPEISTIALPFLIDDTMTADVVKSRIKTVAKEFLRSPAGETVRANGCGDFTYRDLAANNIPDELYIKYGLTPLFREHDIDINVRDDVGITENLASIETMMDAVKTYLAYEYETDPDNYPFALIDPPDDIVRQIAQLCEDTEDEDAIYVHALQIMGPSDKHN